ncbi:MAG: helix-turn-helix domain-containing protein [Bryobacteraceae bacterium]|nr:helix-turn-helix domain-containing protein [Bryobacteraceae bacterium]
MLESVGRACQVLKLFRDENEALGLAEVAQRSGLEKTIAFRILRTLEQHGLLRRTAEARYVSNVRIGSARRFRIGYAAQEHNTPFSDAVTASLRRAAAREGVELVVTDNRYSANVALKNARKLIGEKIDLAIEFQTHERVAPVISSLFEEAGIPLIAIGTPHPGASFYGANNYRAGLTAGRALGKWVRRQWDGEVGELLLLEIELKGALPKLRLTGAEAALREAAPPLPADRVFHLDTRGSYTRTMELVRDHLRRRPARSTVIAGITDLCVLAALRAFEEAGQLESCAAIGMGTIGEARSELMKPDTRLIGSISFFPEKYGDDVMRLALDILHKRPTPPAVYAQHRLITRDNLRRHYPAEGQPELRGFEGTQRLA